MEQAFRIFIGWDSRFPEPAYVLEESIKAYASIPVDVTFLRYAELQEEHGFNRAYDPLASTEFTYTRFLVPHLCEFEGIALFMDNDMLCLGDVAELAQLDMLPYALRVVKHDYQPVATTKMYGAVQTSYPRKNWSSLMLMDCAKLRDWTLQRVETASGAYLHRFEEIPDKEIGDLDPNWNRLDACDENTKLVHWTSGMVWNHPGWESDQGGLSYRYSWANLWLQARKQYSRNYELRMQQDMHRHRELLERQAR